MDIHTHRTVMPHSLHDTAPDLPVPNSDEVEEFRSLYRAKMGVELDAETALGLLTSLVGFFYLTHYDTVYDPLRPLRPQEPGG